MKLFLSAAFLAFSAVAVQAAPEPYKAICIVWDGSGNQLFGEPCFVHEWNGQFRAVDARSDNPYIGGAFDFFVNDDAAPGPQWRVEGKIGQYGNVLETVVRHNDGVFYWQNGRPAISVEEYEGD